MSNCRVCLPWRSLLSFQCFLRMMQARTVQAVLRPLPKSHTLGVQCDSQVYGRFTAAQTAAARAAARRRG